LSENAVEFVNISKKFRIYHEKRSSVYEAILGWFSKKKHYENLTVLDDLSFSIKKGEMFGIIGKNGMGKTTLLRVMAGIYKPDSGHIINNGSIVPFLGLGANFQLDLTAKANIIQYGILLGLSNNEIKKNIEKIIEFSGLEKFADTKLKNFSNGMYARLAFATAVQADPDILLIDEILQVGDLEFQKKSYEKILSFKKQGKTIVIVTHDINTIQKHCDRSLLLNNGKIEALGNPTEVVKKYREISYQE